MQVMDGLELSRLVKRHLQIKIIILSGYNEFDYAKTAISIGVTDYLLKPISSAKLLEAVKKVGDMIEKEQDNVRLMERYEKLHIASGSLGRDVLKRHLTGWSWRIVVIFCTACSGVSL